MEVPSEVLQKLVCENCDGYLSRGPVHLMENVKYRCGRCLPSKEEQGTRIEVYEELAKLMTFPCKYREKGCPSKVSFMENEGHEEACPYREHICPIAASGQCEWTGIQKELLEHCQQEHPDNVVENPCKLTHNITRNSLNNYLVWTLGVLFFIQTKVCTASRKIYHSVRLIGDPATASNYKYTLCIQNKDIGYYKSRQVAPRGYLALQKDSSIQTDINGLLAMLEDFRDTTFTVTIESTGNSTPAKTLEVKVKCSSCRTETEPVYKNPLLGWLCRDHAPARNRCGYSYRCTYTDVDVKCWKHEDYYCPYRSWCGMCIRDTTGMTRDSHYAEAHGDVTFRAGTVCSVRFGDSFIIDCDFGRAVCTYSMWGTHVILNVCTSLPSEQLYKYRCAVEISHPKRGRTLICTPTVRYDASCDWEVPIPRTDFEARTHDKKINTKINITKIEDPSEFRTTHSSTSDVITMTTLEPTSTRANFWHTLFTKSKE